MWKLMFLMNGRVFWWNWTDWRGIMIRRRRHYSLDSCVYEGIVYASEDKNLTAIFETDSKFGRLTEAIKYLSDKQKSLIKAVYFDGMSVSDYAKHMGISQSAVSQQLKTIYKKLKKFL